MPLSWNEIRARAITFQREWQDETREHAEAKSFWDAFFYVFGMTRRRLASFEAPVHIRDQRLGFIDLFWKGKLLVEHKSRGRDLDSAYAQATDYFPGIDEADLPRYVLVSDFARFRLTDLDERETHEFPITEFHRHIHLFSFVAGYTEQTYADEDPINIIAAEKMGRLHDALAESGYALCDLEQFLVRILFCLFADDTAIFEPDAFGQYLRNRTSEDGSDLGMHLGRIFQVLNEPAEARNANLDEDLAALPYVNGGLFADTLPIADFTAEMRQRLLECSRFDWSRISPAIFGSMFQSIMDPERRRNLGAHYTSEKNILKLIRPLFLDGLEAELDSLLALRRGRRQRLEAFHEKLANLRFFDPACGCGNFLVITYRELRRLETKLLHAQHDGQMSFDIAQHVKVDVNQMYGIEIEEFPAKIAETALWLTDHQANEALSRSFGLYFVRIPLRQSPHILCANALQTDWNTFAPPQQIHYIISNPPFGGARLQSPQQKADLKAIFNSRPGYGSLDFVACWYQLAAKYIQGTNIKVALVSTNSISQGEQPGILWPELFENYHISIHFAHRTFQWRNEARGNAAVHCVIIGFAALDSGTKTIYEYEDPKAQPHGVTVSHISPYLIEGSNLTISNRTTPLCNVPGMGIGNKPIDGGNYLFTPEEKAAFIQREPEADRYFRPWMGANEFLHNRPRWVLWLGDASPAELRRMPAVLERIEAVRKLRLASKSPGTRAIAATPTRYHVENMPCTRYLLIPKVSSERRPFIPIGFMEPVVISSDLCFVIPDARLYHFGILSSSMHMAWVRTVCGRLESRYRYSNKVAYNNYPWPAEPSEAATVRVEHAAQNVLDARDRFPDSTLADLYDPLTMPPVLTDAHRKLDRAVDGAYGRATFATETERLTYLFGLYEKYAAPLTAAKPSKRRRSKGA